MQAKRAAWVGLRRSKGERAFFGCKHQVRAGAGSFSDRRVASHGAGGELDGSNRARTARRNSSGRKEGGVEGDGGDEGCGGGGVVAGDRGGRHEGW
jgi:hypothetical protein